MAFQLNLYPINNTQEEMDAQASLFPTKKRDFEKTEEKVASISAARFVPHLDRDGKHVRRKLEINSLSETDSLTFRANLPLSPPKEAPSTDTLLFDARPVFTPSTEIGSLGKLPKIKRFSKETHSELAKARYEQKETPHAPISRKNAPKTPIRVHHHLKAKAEKTPLVQNARAIRNLIAAKIGEKTETGSITPFEFEVVPGLKLTIEDINWLSSSGNFMDVYRFTVRGMGDYVLKLYKLDTLEKQPQNIALYTAGQLLCYAKNRQDPFMNDHLAKHLNFEPHLKKVNEIMSDFPDHEVQIRALQKYLSGESSAGFLFVPFVPGSIPAYSSANDPRWGGIKDDPIWKQIKGMFEASDRLEMNDLRRDNVGVDAEGKVLLFDMVEAWEENTFAMSLYELIASFTDNKATQEWLLPENFREVEQAPIADSIGSGATSSSSNWNNIQSLAGSYWNGVQSVAAGVSNSDKIQSIAAGSSVADNGSSSWSDED